MTLPVISSVTFDKATYNVGDPITATVLYHDSNVHQRSTTGPAVVQHGSNSAVFSSGTSGTVAVTIAAPASGNCLVACIGSGMIEFFGAFVAERIRAMTPRAALLASLSGAGLAFLWFNAYPAQVFMGDVGALALGGALGTIAVIVRQEIVLFIMGGVFVAETLSVMIQVMYFKYSGGKRIFRMAPLHHHYELKGWKENQVVVRFWIISMMLVLFGLSTLKLR